MSDWMVNLLFFVVGFFGGFFWYVGWMDGRMDGMHSHFFFFFPIVFRATLPSPAVWEMMGDLAGTGHCLVAKVT